MKLVINFIIKNIGLPGFFFICSGTYAQHKSIYLNSENRQEVLEKIKDQQWAEKSFDALLKSINPYVDRHQSDPVWIISRLAMYWEKDRHYTQCYLKDQHWEYGEGNAPVPTLRFPGMRTWNSYINVPLEDRIAYNKTGDMLGISKKDTVLKPVLVPYKESGHMIRYNNLEILTLAEKAAFVYALTGTQKYAQFASDIFYTWMLGVYYSKPCIDLNKSLGGAGGYSPGGISGYYDYEVIHDDQAKITAEIYDLMYDYLNDHPVKPLKNTGKSLREVTNEVYKRFIEIGSVRGGKTGNWNVNGWACVLPLILQIENNDYFTDGRGKEYFLNLFTKQSTQYHNAVPDILKEYDPVTGLWPESPGYGFGVIGSLLNFTLPIYRTGTNLINDNPAFEKAALAVFPWLDARANMVVFGDYRGGSADFKVFENLLSYYTWEGNDQKAALAASAIQKGIDLGIYSRDNSDWRGIIFQVQNLPAANKKIEAILTAYSKFHRHIVQKNGKENENQLMTTLYGGYPHKFHLSANGLAAQFYGKGYALSPDASAYESYWSNDYLYHQGPLGANTIVPGYSSGPVTVNAIEPDIPEESFTNTAQVSKYHSFADVSADEKRRMTAIVRTSETTGFYVDIFRSDLPLNDYIYHNVGNSITSYDKSGSVLSFAGSELKPIEQNEQYSYFKNSKKTAYSEDFKTTWTINQSQPVINMDLWMTGQKGREIYHVQAPSSYINKSLTPAGVSTVEEKTPALIVRQINNNAWGAPFISVLEPYYSNEKSINEVRALKSQGEFTLLQVKSRAALRNREDYVFYSIREGEINRAEAFIFKGLFGAVSIIDNDLNELYLGKGLLVQWKNYKIEMENQGTASFLYSGEGIYYSASDDVKLTVVLPKKKGKAASGKLRLYRRINQQWLIVPSTVDLKNNTITGSLPKGNEIELKIE